MTSRGRCQVLQASEEAATSLGRGMAVTLLADEIESVLGVIALAAWDGHMVALDFAERREEMMASLRARLGGIRLVSTRDPYGFSSRVGEYLAGHVEAIESIPVRPGGTPFQEQVWRELRAIPAGTTMTYKQMATRVMRPTAVRAVGGANARNPIAIVIPCHRLVGSHGSLTGYGGGLSRKGWLLAHERASVGGGGAGWNGAAASTPRSGASVALREP